MKKVCNYPNLSATGWDESSTMDRAGDTGLVETGGDMHSDT